MHAADAMTRGAIVYVVKFFGRCEVDRPKGTETVKEAIRKMKVGNLTSGRMRAAIVNDRLKNFECLRNGTCSFLELNPFGRFRFF